MKLLKQCRGAVAVEFALVAIPLTFLLMGILEFCLVSVANYHLQNVVSQGARIGKTGYNGTAIGAGAARNSYIQAQMTGLMNIMFTGFSSSMVVTPVADWNAGIPACTPGSAISVDGGAGGVTPDQVAYVACVRWPIFTPLMQPFFNVDGTGAVLLTQFTMVQNEPF